MKWIEQYCRQRYLVHLDEGNILQVRKEEFLQEPLQQQGLWKLAGEEPILRLIKEFQRGDETLHSSVRCRISNVYVYHVTCNLLSLWHQGMIINSEFPYHITPGALKQISNLKATSKLFHLQGLVKVWSIRILPGNAAELTEPLWEKYCAAGQNVAQEMVHIGGAMGSISWLSLFVFLWDILTSLSILLYQTVSAKKDPTNFWPIRWLYTHIIIEFLYSTARYSALLSPWNQYAIIKGSKWGRHIPVVSTLQLLMVSDKK